MVAIVLVRNAVVVEDGGGVLMDVELGAQVLMQCAVNASFKKVKTNLIKSPLQVL